MSANGVLRRVDDAGPGGGARAVRRSSLPAVVKLWPLLSLGISLCVAGAGCSKAAPKPVPKQSVPAQRPVPFHPPYTIELPKADQRLGTAVVVLLDTSGSMNESVRDRSGGLRPKHEIAREALEGILDYTNQWKQKKPDRVLELGIYRFSSSAHEVLPIGPFDFAKLQAALRQIPRPGANTAIGDALEQGFKALYRTGCTRKFVVCISDGENTAGNPPDYIARILYEQTKGEVEIHFVAFDTSPQKFGFLEKVNGSVVEAADGKQLQARLTDIYEKRILAEAPPAEQ